MGLERQAASRKPMLEPASRDRSSDADMLDGAIRRAHAVLVGAQWQQVVGGGCCTRVLATQECALAMTLVLAPPKISETPTLSVYFLGLRFHLHHPAMSCICLHCICKVRIF